MLALIAATIVGLVEVAPGICRVDLQTPTGPVITIEKECEKVAPTYEPLP